MARNCDIEIPLALLTTAHKTISSVIAKNAERINAIACVKIWRIKICQDDLTANESASFPGFDVILQTNNKVTINEPRVIMAKHHVYFVSTIGEERDFASSIGEVRGADKWSWR